MSAIPLSYGDLALAACLVLLNGLLSIRLSLSLERQLLVAALRAFVQLMLVGFLLKALFASSSPWATALVALAMFAIASYEVSARQERRLAGWWGYGVGSGAMVLATSLVTVFALLTQLEPDPWYAPRYLIPLLGIILGSVMNGVSLSLNNLITSVARERAAIEAQLALGADRFTALKPFLRRSLRNGIIPIINQMSAAGVITLPGMMTGQVLAGMDPTEAAKYQILILFLLAGGTGLGVLGAAWVGMLRLTDERHRLRLDRLSGM